MMKKLVFQTDLDMDECLQRLERQTTRILFPEYDSIFMKKYKEGRFRLNYTLGLSSLIWPNWFDISNWRNSFKPFFYGRLIREGTGTRIEGQFSMHPFVRVFMAIWFTLIIVFSILFSLASLSDLIYGSELIQGTGSKIMGILIPWTMVLFGFGLLKLGKWLSKSHEEIILSFLENTLDARRIE